MGEGGNGCDDGAPGTWARWGLSSASLRAECAREMNAPSESLTPH